MSEPPEIRLSGTPASAGVAIGPAIVIDPQAVVVPDLENPAAAFSEASAAVSRQLVTMCETARAAGRSEAGDVLEAQALMAQDPMLADAVTAALDNGVGLDVALQQARQQIEDLFAGIDDPYIAARATDVVEVTDRICRWLAGVEVPDLGQIAEPSVLVARALSAADTAALDPASVLGFVTEAGGPTSHVAIIARSLGVAAVVGGAGIVECTKAGDPVAIDGATGDIVVRPADVTIEDFAARREAFEVAVAAADRFRGISVALGEHPVQVPANVGSRDDIERALAAASEGIGLLRTEFLFLDRSEAAPARRSNSTSTPSPVPASANRSSSGPSTSVGTNRRPTSTSRQRRIHSSVYAARVSTASSPKYSRRRCGQSFEPRSTHRSG